MQVSLDKAEYRALNALRGLPDGAQMLLMCSLPTATGGMLEGPEEDFSELVAFIGEQIADRGLSAAAAALHAVQSRQA